MNPEQRARVGRLWFDAALGEHASIAAFGRLVLEMVAMGAPPDLIKRAAGAITDETEHARLCFGIARRFTGTAAGPGRLAMSGADLARCDDPGAIVMAAVAEGCVFETVSARHAAVAAELARDGAIRDILAQIAVDEDRHAELSWAFVEWALAQQDELRPAAAMAFEEAVARLATAFAEDRDDDDTQEDFGLLRVATKRRTAVATLVEIKPRWERLLGPSLLVCADASLGS